MKSNTTNNMKRISLLFIIPLFINDVFGDKDDIVSVNDGGSVTLHTNLTDLKRVDVITWRFKGHRIARINREANDTPVYEPDKRFTDRLKMNPQTGDLTITHITSEHTGEYQQEIIKDKTTTKNFSVSLSSKVNTVMDGDSVSLHIDVTEKQRNDKIHWKIKHNNSPVAEIITQNGTITKNKTCNEFGGILKLNDQTGDVTISNMKNEDFGPYEADVTIGSNTYTIHKTFCFGRCGFSSGVIAGICVGLLVLVIAAVVGGRVIFRRCTKKRQVTNTGDEPMGTQEHLRNGDISNESNRGNELAVINGSLNQSSV